MCFACLWNLIRSTAHEIGVFPAIGWTIFAFAIDCRLPCELNWSGLHRIEVLVGAVNRESGSGMVVTGKCTLAALLRPNAAHSLGSSSGCGYAGRTR